MLIAINFSCGTLDTCFSFTFNFLNLKSHFKFWNSVSNFCGSASRKHDIVLFLFPTWPLSTKFSLGNTLSEAETGSVLTLQMFLDQMTLHTKLSGRAQWDWDKTVSWNIKAATFDHGKVVLAKQYYLSFLRICVTYQYLSMQWKNIKVYQFLSFFDMRLNFHHWKRFSCYFFKK